MQLDAEHQSAAAHLLDSGQALLPQPIEKAGAHPRGVFNHIFFHQHFKGGSRHRAGQRVAPESAAVLSRFEDIQHLRVGKHRRNGVKAARKRLAHQGDVRFDAFMLFGQQFAGAAEAGLDFVQDHHHIVPTAQVTRLFQITRRRKDHAGLALNRLHHESNGLGRDRRFQGFDVAEGNDREPGRERPETMARHRIGAEPHDGDGAAVKIVGADDDPGTVRRYPFDLVSPLARHLDDGLDGFGPAVHRQHFVGARQVAQLLVKQAELVIAERAGRQGEFAGLVDHRGQNPGVAVPLIDGRIGRQAVHVTAAVDIPHPDPPAAAQDHVQRVVVVRPIALFQSDIRLRVHAQAFPVESVACRPVLHCKPDNRTFVKVTIGCADSRRADAACGAIAHLHADDHQNGRAARAWRDALATRS